MAPMPPEAHAHEPDSLGGLREQFDGSAHRHPHVFDASTMDVFLAILNVVEDMPHRVVGDRRMLARGDAAATGKRMAVFFGRKP